MQGIAKTRQGGRRKTRTTNIWKKLAGSITNFNYQSVTMDCHGSRIQIMTDVLGIAVVAIGVSVIHFATEPFQRGFFCDDESLKHPVNDDIVSNGMIIAMSYGCCIALMCIIEIQQNTPKTKRRKAWVFGLYRYIIIFIFGNLVTILITEMAKRSVGRLRPYFLTLCNPDYSKLNCDAGTYITDFVCTSTDEKALKKARLSFPSGHASWAMYSTTYIILYLQYRMICPKALFFKPLIQLVLFCMGFFACLSRISDYSHHPGDVLAGAVLGIVVGLVTVFCLTDFGKAARQSLSWLLGYSEDDNMDLDQVLATITRGSSSDKFMTNSQSHVSSHPHADVMSTLMVIGLTDSRTRAAPHDSSNSPSAVEMGSLQAIKSTDTDTNSSKQ